MVKVFSGHDMLARMALVLLLISVLSRTLPSVQASSDPVKCADWNTELMWEEDFETYAVETFPSPSWNLWTSGMGVEEQRIVETISASGNKSLRMHGKYYWAAIAARPVTITVGTKIGFEVMILAENNGTAPEVTGGATVAFASDSPSPALWRQWGKIIFRSDRKIVAAGQEMGAYSLKQWYKVKEVFDVFTKTFQVWINDELKSQSLIEDNPDPATDAKALALVSDHAQQVCYFDSIKVFKMVSLLVLQQDFDKEITGEVPAGWDMVAPEYGIITVDDIVHYGEQGKSAKVMDTSIRGSPSPYRNFTEQTGIIVVTFAIRLATSNESEGGLEVYVDNGSFAGVNTIFSQDGRIQYRDQYGQLVLLHRSSFRDSWHRVKIILNIPKNVYDVHIDDHLDAVNARFTAACKQIHRIIINFTSPQMRSVGYIDDLKVVRCLTIPEDFPTIQEGIDAADQGDVIWVKERIYFENIMVCKSIWLIGENATTTVIDGHFIKTEKRWSSGISVLSDNVTIYGFTIKNAEEDGIYFEGSNNTVTNSILTSALDNGIRIIGSGNTLANNTIESNNGCGVRITSGKGNVVKKNIIKNNAVGLRCEESAEGNRIYQNRFICNIVQAQDSGQNTWDDGYPYNAAEEKGGGNYWSDLFSEDMYSGVNQDKHGPCGTPLPDGICDLPRTESGIPPNGQDNYPLFLIQNVTQKPESGNVTYKDNVNVTVAVLEDVQIEKAKIYVEKTYVDNSTKQEEIAMNVTRKEHNEAGRPSYQCILKGIIPREPWSTRIRYNISAQAYHAPWLNTTNYPLTAPYHISDPYRPIIWGIRVDPPSPNEDQTISVHANVTEDVDASGVDKVLLAYNVGDSTWRTEMKEVSQLKTVLNITIEYVAVMPKQPGNARLSFAIEAFDKAGNRNDTSTPIYVKLLADLLLKYKGTVCDDPCNVDFGVMSKGARKDDNLLSIFNNGNETLQWEIKVAKTLPRDSGSWLDFTPKGLNLTPNGTSTSVTIIVNTTHCYAGLYSGELSIRANGSTSQWAIVVNVWVGKIIIDRSWASIEPPNRCNVGTYQTVAYHAVWAHNASDATSGQIKVKGKWQPVNASGWATFSVHSSEPGNIAFPVEEVNFTHYVDTASYSITSLNQIAPRPWIVWDRVKIDLRISDDRIDVCSEANISWSNSVYESDNSLFKGYPQFNDTLHHDLVGRWCITTSSIVDLKYNLTAFASNSITCIWDQVKIIAGGVPTQQVGIGQQATVWFIAIYEYDNTLFKENWDVQQPCSLYVNVSESGKMNKTEPLIWSAEKERWENYSSSTGGTRSFQISGVNDTKYNLTKIDDRVGRLNITWGPILWTPFGAQPAQSSLSADTQPIPSQFMQEVLMWTALAMTLVIVLSASFLFLRKKGTPRGKRSITKTRVSQPKPIE